MDHKDKNKNPIVDWTKAVKPLIKKYKDEKHPLSATNLYQMLVMVVLSAQTTDNVVNQVAPELFKAFPSMSSLARAQPEEIQRYITRIRSFGNKSKWLVKIATELKKDSAIPLVMADMIKLPGIGRKSANVIKRWADAECEGIVVDLHTIRVAIRLGIVSVDDPKKIEEQMMQILPKTEWDAGMAMSFLGRDICRPTPECQRCLMNKVCAYYNNIKN